MSWMHQQSIQCIWFKSQQAFVYTHLYTSLWLHYTPVYTHLCLQHNAKGIYNENIIDNDDNQHILA